jgi:hypothetical protein
MILHRSPPPSSPRARWKARSSSFRLPGRAPVECGSDITPRLQPKGGRPTAAHTDRRRLNPAEQPFPVLLPSRRPLRPPTVNLASAFATIVCLGLFVTPLPQHRTAAPRPFLTALAVPENRRRRLSEGGVPCASRGVGRRNWFSQSGTSRMGRLGTAPLGSPTGTPLTPLTAGEAGRASCNVHCTRTTAACAGAGGGAAAV